MTVGTTTNKVSWLGNGTTGPFTWNIPYQSQSHLKFYRASATGVLTPENPASITNTAGGVNGGQATLSSPLAIGEMLVLQRIVPLTQAADFRNNAGYTPEKHENAFDYGIMLQQQIDERLSRSMVLPLSETPTDAQVTWPTVAARANKTLSFDGNGAPTVAAPTSQTIPAPGGGNANRLLRVAADGSAWQTGEKSSGLTGFTTTPLVALMADSLFKNHYASGTFESLLVANPWNGQVPAITNISVVGRPLRVILDKIETELNPLYAGNSGMNIVVFEGGHNDFNEGTSAPQAASYMIEAARKARRYGWRVVCTTLASAQGKDAWRNEFNGYIRKARAEFDEIADFARDALMGFDGAYTNVTYFYTDGNHYTLAGYTRQAAWVQAAIDRILFGTGNKLALGQFGLLGKLIGANFNTTADQVIFIDLPPGATKYWLLEVHVTNASTNLNTAAGGLYTTASKGGTMFVDATQTYADCATSAGLQRCTLTAAGKKTIMIADTRYLSLTTPQGAPATADVYLFGVAVP